jgi:hypothetical protein
MPRYRTQDAKGGFQMAKRARWQPERYSTVMQPNIPCRAEAPSSVKLGTTFGHRTGTQMIEQWGY